jgi:hypothetical protein
VVMSWHGDCGRVGGDPNKHSRDGDRSGKKLTDYGFSRHA